MAVAKNTLSALLACTLLLANTVCACAMPETESPDTNPHAHHQAQGVSTSAENVPCTHDACEGCAFFVPGATAERDTILTGTAKTGVDDDVVWVIAAAYSPPAVTVAARGSPPVHGPPGLTQTPVSLTDRLLE